MIEPYTLWDDISAVIKSELGEIVHRNWIRHLVVKSNTAHDLILNAPTRFIKEWVESNYINVILSIAKSVLPTITNVVIEVNHDIAENPAVITSNQNVALDTANITEKKACDILDFNLETKFTFENFVVGTCNQAAYSACKMVAENKMCGNFKVIYVYGSVGQGKTHLLQSVASYMKKNGEHNCLYLSAEKFLHLFVKYTRNNDLISFKEKIKSSHLLIVDDLQFICGKSGTAQEFSNILSSFLDSGKTVILSSDTNPFALNLDQRTKSRISSGFCVEITQPEYELRKSVLEQKILRAGVAISSDIVELIALNLSSNIREVEGAINQIIAHYNLSGCPPTLSSAKMLLKNNFSAKQKSITLSDIIEIIAAYYKVEVSDLKGKSRAAKLILPRQIFAVVAKDLTTHSMQDIGKFLGSRDHTSIVYYIKQINNSVATNTSINDDIAAIKGML